MILYGASGHAKVIIDICKKIGKEITFIWDDNPEIKEILNISVLQPESQVGPNEKIIVSIGDNRTRKQIVDKNQFQFGTAIHPSAIIDSTSVIGTGTVVMAGTIVNSSVSINDHCIVNTSASIDHDCKMDNFVHISPNATICGGVNIGEGTQVGAGAVIIPNLNIGKWCKIGAGAVVVRNVPDGATVVGNPGRMVKIG